MTDLPATLLVDLANYGILGLGWVLWWVERKDHAATRDTNRAYMERTSVESLAAATRQAEVMAGFKAALESVKALMEGVRSTVERLGR